MSFYGDIVGTGDSPFVFDKIYSSRYHMEQSMADDNIFVGRYVLVSYDSSFTHNNFKRVYRKSTDDITAKNIYLYKDSTCQEPVKIKSNNEGEELTAYVGDIYYVIDGETYNYYQCINYLSSNSIALFNFYEDLTYSWKEAYYSTENGTMSKLGSDTYRLYKDANFQNCYSYTEDENDFENVKLGDIVFVREYDKEVSEKEKTEGYYTFYECTAFIEEEARFKKLSSVLGKYEEGSFDNFLVNQKIDYLKYGRNIAKNYDKTVWQKVYIGNKEKYIKIADLNVKIPDLNISVDAPTLMPVAPYFDSDIGETGVKDLHIQPSWGLRVRAANAALSEDGLISNETTNNYASYIESIENKVRIFVEDVCSTERDYQTNVEASYSVFNNLKSGKEEAILNYIQENYDETASTSLTTEIEDNLSEIITNYIGEQHSFYNYSYDNYGPVDLQFYRIENRLTDDITYSDLVKAEELQGLTLYFDAQVEAYFSEIIEGLKTLCNNIGIQGQLFNKTNCKNIFSTANQIVNIIKFIFTVLDLEYEDIKEYFEDRLERIIETEDLYLNGSLLDKDSILDPIVEEITTLIIDNLNDSVLLSDENIVWKADNFYFNGSEWQQDETSFAGDIYYNKDGFNKEYTIKDRVTEDSISVEPTGYSQNILSDGTAFNKSYSDNDENTFYGATKEAPDTQELSIHLPSIGNTISDVWDIIYGEGVEDEDGNLKRRLNVSWDEDFGDINDASRNRMVELKDDGIGFTYDRDSLSTVAGTINSIQDLMGKIIIEDVTINNKTYKSAASVPSEEVRDYVDKSKIYYFSDDGLYYKATDKYEFREYCYPSDEYDNIKSSLQLSDGSNAPDTFDPTKIYYLKSNPEQKVLIYNYVDTEEEYINEVQGFAEVDTLYDPNNMPSGDNGLYYLDASRNRYIYKTKYQKEFDYFTLDLTPSPFNSAPGEYRMDDYGNLFYDEEYQWRGQDYYYLADILNEATKGYIFIPKKYYIDIADEIGSDTPVWNAARTVTFDPEQTYYSLTSLGEVTPIVQPDGSIIYVTEETPDPVLIYKPGDKTLTDEQNYYHYINTADLVENGGTIELETEYWSIELEDIDELDTNVSGFRKVKTYVDKTTEDNAQEPKMFYAIPKAIFEEDEDAEESTARQPIKKYEPGEYYYSIDSGEGNLTNNYQLDVSETGNKDRDYYALTAINVIPHVYQPGTIYYRKYNLPPDGREEYILSNAAFDPEETYYVHNTYYVTNNYDSYQIGQIWDYTLPWTDYVLDTHGYRDKTNYAEQLAILEREGEEIPDLIYRPYYYDVKGKRLVHWREDFAVTENNQFYTAGDSFVEQTTPDKVTNRTYYVGEKDSITGELKLDTLQPAVFYEPGKFFFQNPNVDWYVKDTNDSITSGRTYYYDKNGETEVLFKDRFNEIVNRGNIYYYNLNNNFEEVSATSPDGNTSYVYDKRFDYYQDNQGDMPVYFKELWNEYLTSDNPKHNFYIPNFDKENSVSLVKERNYYQNDLERTKIHLSDADWLLYNNRYEDYEEGYYGYRLDTNNEVTMGRQYYTLNGNRYIPVNYLKEQFDDYKTSLKVEEIIQVPTWSKDVGNTVNAERNYFKDEGNTPAYLIQQFEKVCREREVYTRTAHAVKRYIINNDPLNSNTQYYLDEEGITKIYFVNGQYPYFGLNTDTLEIYHYTYVPGHATYQSGVQYFTFDGTNYNEVEYIAENFSNYCTSLEIKTIDENDNEIWSAVGATDAYQSEAEYRLASTGAAVVIEPYNPNTMYYYTQIWETIDKTNPIAYDSNATYRLNNIIIPSENIIQNYTTGLYYTEVSGTEYRYEPVAAGTSYNSSQQYYINQIQINFENYAPNVYYYWDMSNTISQFVNVTINDIYYNNKTYITQNNETVIFKDYEANAYYYFDKENIQYKTLTDADVRNLDVSKTYYYNHDYSNNIEFYAYSFVKNNCWYYNDESQLNVDYLLQTIFDENRQYYYIFTETGLQAIQFISTANFPGTNTYYLIDNDDANRQKYILCSSGDNYETSKMYYQLAGNIYNPILFVGWISNKYYYVNNNLKPMSISFDEQAIVGYPYFLDAAGTIPVLVHNDAQGLWYNNINEMVFTAEPIGRTAEGTTKYYVKLLNPVHNGDYINYTGSDGNKYNVRLIASTAIDDKIIDGYYYYNITGYEDEETLDTFDYQFLPVAVKDRNNDLYLEYQLEDWQASKFYYANDYTESIKQSKLVSKELLDQYKKYYFEELVGFSRNYNTVNGLILQFNQALGNRNTYSRDLDTLYGSINRLNDEIRRLKIYDFSTVNNIISSIEYSFNTVTNIHKQLKSIQDQVTGTEGDLLTEFEAAAYYPNILNIDYILGTDIAGMERTMSRVVYSNIPEGASSSVYPIAYASDGVTRIGYWHIIDRDNNGNIIYETAATIKDPVSGVIQLSQPNNRNLFTGVNYGSPNNTIIQEIKDIDAALKNIANTYVKINDFNTTLGCLPGNFLTIKNPVTGENLSDSVTNLFNRTSETIITNAQTEQAYENYINNILFDPEATDEEKDAQLEVNNRFKGILNRLDSIQDSLSKVKLYTEDEFNAKVKDLIDEMGIKDKITEDEDSEKAIIQKEVLLIDEELESDYSDKMNITLTGQVVKETDEEDHNTYYYDFTISVETTATIPKATDWFKIGHIDGIVLNTDKQFPTSESTEGGSIAQIKVKILAETGDIVMQNLSDWGISSEPYVYHVSDTSITLKGGLKAESKAVFKIHSNDTFISAIKKYTAQTALVVKDEAFNFNSIQVLPKAPTGLDFKGWKLIAKDNKTIIDSKVYKTGDSIGPNKKLSGDKTLYEWIQEGASFVAIFENSTTKDTEHKPLIFLNSSGIITDWSRTYKNKPIKDWIKDKTLNPNHLICVQKKNDKNIYLIKGNKKTESITSYYGTRIPVSKNNVEPSDIKDKEMYRFTDKNKILKAKTEHNQFNNYDAYFITVRSTSKMNVVYKGWEQS